MALKRPVFILGAPRAGTSIIGRILQQHPDFVHAKEPRLVWKYGNDSRSDQLSSLHARPEVSAYIRKHFSKLIDQQSGSRLLEKTPSNSLRVPFIEAIFPDAQYIHITRNGYDSAASIKSYWLNFTRGTGQGRIGDEKSILRQRLEEMHPSQIPYYAAELLSRFKPAKPGQPRTLWGPRLPGLKQMVRDMDLLEVAATQWKQCTERASIHGRALGPERYFEVRLEDLTLEKVDDIFAFLGMEMDDKVRDYFAETFDPTLSHARRNMLTDTDRTLLRPILEPTINWLGYSEPE